MPENPENQARKEELGLGEIRGAPITPMREPPSPVPKEEKAEKEVSTEARVEGEAEPAEAEAPEELSMRQRQEQVNQRVGLQGQELPGPRLAQDRQKAPAPMAPVAGAAKKAAKKWAPFLLPLGSAGIGGAIGYLITT